MFCDGGLCPPWRSYISIRLVAPRCAVSPLVWIVSSSGHVRLTSKSKLQALQSDRVSHPSKSEKDLGYVEECVFCDGGLCPPWRSYISIRLVAPRCAVSPLVWIVSSSGHVRLCVSAELRFGSSTTFAGVFLAKHL
eukprot:COSAG02_NODE_801_length_17030_cov_150.308428_14_plen_136_part_00